VAEGKRGDPKRRAPASRPGASGRGRSRPSQVGARESRPTVIREESTGHGLTEPIRRVLAESVQQQSEDRLGLTARRAAILAGMICVLTLTIAGPVRTYFGQRTEMKQLAASEKALRAQISELETQKTKLADPVYIAAQARERLGFVKPGDIPYQVQLPPGQQPQAATGPSTAIKFASSPKVRPWRMGSSCGDANDCVLSPKSGPSATSPSCARRTRSLAAPNQRLFALFLPLT
jgi:cell division protein DivIC